MDNFYVTGDWQGSALRVVVARAGERPATDLPVITSPSVSGLLLVRVIVHDEQMAARSTPRAARSLVRRSMCRVRPQLRLPDELLSPSVAKPTQPDADVTLRCLLGWPVMIRLLC